MTGVATTMELVQAKALAHRAMLPCARRKSVLRVTGRQCERIVFFVPTADLNRNAGMDGRRRRKRR